MNDKSHTKNCKHHGVVEGHTDNNGYIRCKKCRSEAVIRSRKKRKIDLLKYKGGKCEICGYDKCVAALDFHHKDSNEKEFGIAAKGMTRSWGKMTEEVDKCMVVCSNCHRELHYAAEAH